MAIGPLLRFEILKRDGFRCMYCGRVAATIQLHVDHVIPRAFGGSDAPENLVTACLDCNLGKGGRGLEAKIIDETASPYAGFVRADVARDQRQKAIVRSAAGVLHALWCQLTGYARDGEGSELRHEMVVEALWRRRFNRLLVTILECKVTGDPTADLANTIELADHD